VTERGPAITIRRVDRSCDQILANLLAQYIYDMAEWFLLDADELGRYSYATDAIWLPGSHVDLAYVDRIPVGFALTCGAESFTDVVGTRDLHEFFVVRRHRRAGFGRQLAAHVWDTEPGPWLVRVYQGNVPALPFWRNMIDDYTGGRFREEVLQVKERPWSYFWFDSATR
jgi:predicted acetyltransferase